MKTADNIRKGAIHFLFISFSLFVTATTNAVDPAEHAKHHPGAAGAAGPAATGMPAKPGAAPGGMMAAMGDMMQEMGKPKTKEIFPTLMDSPELTVDQSIELKAQANDFIKAGADLMNTGLVSLTNAAEKNDFKEMDNSLAIVQEGLSQFKSGVGIRRSLDEGKSGQETALIWFKNNLSIESAESSQTDEHGNSGLSFFHLFLMVFLISFAIIMIGMYFYKMKRATKLLESLGGGSSPTSAKPAESAPAGNKRTPEVHPSIIEHGTAKGLPVHWKGKLKVARIFSETPIVKTFRFVNPEEGKDLPFTYQAGQFINLGVTIDGKMVKRAYSIASHPCEHDALELTIKREDHGLVSRYMHDVLREGDLLEFEAAQGTLTLSGMNDQAVVLIGGGVGITPLMSVIRCMISCGMKNKIHLLFACKTLEDFIYRDELEAIRNRHPNLSIVVAVDKLEGKFEGAFEGRLTKEQIEKAVPEIAKSRVHLCGPKPMMDAMLKSLEELHVPAEQIKKEAFGPPPAKAPVASPPTPAAATESTGVTLTFKKAGKTVPISTGKSVLETAEESGVSIPFSCRVGTCGLCKVKLLSGKVDMEVEEALTEEDKSQGIILACQAKTTTSLEIEEP